MTIDRPIPPDSPSKTDRFRQVFRRHPAGVVLVTAAGPDGPVAMTATSVCSVNADPALMIFSASGMSSSTPALRQAESVVIHMLDESVVHLAKLGSTSGIDRFEDRALWETLPTGEPRFTDATTWVRGRVIDRMEAPGATVFLVEALDIEVPAVELDARALVYHDRAWHALGEHSRIAS